MTKIKITIEIEDEPNVFSDPCQGCPSKENWKWNGGCVGDCPRHMHDRHTTCLEDSLTWSEARVPFNIEPIWPSGNTGYMATQEMWITRSDGSVVRQHPPAIRYS